MRALLAEVSSIVYRGIIQHKDPSSSWYGPESTHRKTNNPRYEPDVTDAMAKKAAAKDSKERTQNYRGRRTPTDKQQSIKRERTTHSGSPISDKERRYPR